MNITICGTAITFKSVFFLEEIETAGTYRPESITLKNDKDEIIFYTLVGEKGFANNRGICYDATAPDGTEKAVVTLAFSVEEGESAAETAAKKYATMIERAERVESQIGIALSEIRETFDRVGRVISVAG